MPLDRSETLGPGEDGCAYLDDLNTRCGAATKSGSSYCAPHHALCHIAPDRVAAAEAEIADLAERFGGRFARGNKPPKRFLQRRNDAQRT